MQCPNCRYAEQDSAAECSRCGLIFAKWQARAAAAPEATGSEPPLTGAPAAHRVSAGELCLWLSLLGMTLGVWALDHWPEEGAQSQRSSLLHRSAGAAAKPLSSDSWRFEGRVIDLLRESPIKGAKVVLLDLETSRSYEDTTDDDGHFSIDAAIRPRLGYAADVTHPLYTPRFWTGAPLSAPRKDRLRMGIASGSAEPEGKIFKGPGRKKATIAVDFALFPQELTEDEKKEAE